MSEQRREYRSRSPAPAAIQVSVSSANETPVPGQITDLSVRGVGLVFEGVEPPTLAVGDVVLLHLSSPMLQETLVTHSHVRNRVDGEPLRYGFQFSDWLALEASLPTELMSLFNRRSVRRLESRPDRLLFVLVESQELDSKVQAPLLDLSDHGFSFMSLDGLEVGSVVKAALRLPPDWAKVTFQAVIQERTEVRGGSSHRAMFDAELTPAFEYKLRRLQEFLLKGSVDSNRLTPKVTPTPR